MDEPSLVSRMYNGLDRRVGYPIVILTKPIVPVVADKRPWWKFWA